MGSKDEIAIDTAQQADEAKNAEQQQQQQPTVAVSAAPPSAAEGRKAKKVRNAELFAALQETKIKKWSKESLHLYFCIFIAFLCACANGYDSSLMTGILPMEHFQNTFHSGETGSQVSLMFSMYTVGNIVGSPFAAMTSDKLGRRPAMFTAAVIICIGVAVISSSSTVAQFTVGRFILGCGISFVPVSAPAFAAEIAPPHWRGRAVGFVNAGWFGGNIPAAIVNYGCSLIDSDYSWRIPLILQCLPSLIIMASVFFLPESPRYLLANGREDACLDFLVRYHGNGDPNSRLVRLEIDEMRDGIVQDGVDKRPWDYRPLFATRNARWRSLQVVMISVAGQFSGNGLGYFNTVIFGLLGVDSVQQQLAYNVLNSVMSAIGALTSTALTDRMPRRKVLVAGTFACAIALATNAALSHEISKQGDHIQLSYAKGGLATYILFNIIFNFTYTPLQSCVPSEAMETTIRAKGLAFGNVIVGAITFINQYAGPIALQNIGYNYVWVFVGWDFVEALCWFLFGVESQGRTLEQLEWVYDQPNPVKASLKVDKVVLQEDGRVTEKIEV